MNGHGHGEKLTRKQQQAIALLLVERTQADVARKICISERTLSRWKRLPDFQHDYDKAHQEVLNDTVRMLKKGSRDAVRALLRIINSEDDEFSQAATNAEKIAAAKAILDFAFKTVDIKFSEESEPAEGESFLDQIQRAVRQEQGHSETDIT